MGEEFDFEALASCVIDNNLSMGCLSKNLQWEGLEFEKAKARAIPRGKNPIHDCETLYKDNTPHLRVCFASAVNSALYMEELANIKGPKENSYSRLLYLHLHPQI